MKEIHICPIKMRTVVMRIIIVMHRMRPVMIARCWI